MTAPSTANADHPYRSARATPTRIVQRFSLIPIGTAILLVGVAVLGLADDDSTQRWWALLVLVGAAWIVRWDVRRRRRAVSLRIDEDGALFVRDAEGERPLAWNHVTRMNVSLVNSLFVACMGLAGIAAPFAALLDPSPNGSAIRLLAVFFFGAGFGVLCCAEAYGRFRWLPVFLRPNRWSIWFSMSEFEALNDEAKSRATRVPVS